MVGGLFVSSIVSGRTITRTGRWKRWLVSGMVLVVIGLALLGTIDETTHLAVVGVFTMVLGAGLGMTMQNLVLAVQNNTTAVRHGRRQRRRRVLPLHRWLDRRLGARGDVQPPGRRTRCPPGSPRMGIETDGTQSHSIPDLKTLPAPVRELFESAYGSSIGEIFLVAVPFAVLALVAILFIREVPLRTSNLPEPASRPRRPRPREETGPTAGPRR